MDKRSYYLSILFAVIGLLISIYLTLVHYYPSVPLVCSESGVVNCNNVLNSQYAVVYGVPLAVMGVVFFLAELAVIMLIKNNDAFVMLGGVGIAVVVYALYSEYVIGNICIYCTAVHICTLALFIISLMQSRK